jgi:adenylate cyclase
MSALRPPSKSRGSPRERPTSSCALHERPNALWIHRNLAPALLAAGREEAKASRDALAAAYPEFTVARFKEAMVFDPDTLERIADDLRKLGVPEA